MFERLELIIGKENLKKIKEKKVVVIGLGGVGGILCETLVRNGIENITIVDNDIIDITNVKLLNMFCNNQRSNLSNM